MQNQAIFILDWAKFLLSLLFTGLALLVYWYIKKGDSETLASFNLNHKKIVREYRLMLLGNAMMIITAFLYLVTGLTEAGITLLISKFLFSVYILIISTILFSWVRRAK